MDTVADNFVIRPADGADDPAVAAVRRASWRAAYAGIIDSTILERVTAPRSPAAPARQHLTTLVAVAGEPQEVIGYAIIGPERSVAAPIAPPAAARELTEAGEAGKTSEVYAIYLAPNAAP
jgi:hypothetical protein